MRFLSLVVFTLSCAAENPHAVTLQNEPPKPVAAVDASLLPPSPHAASAHACVMLYECGCNAGCTEIDHAMTSLKPNMAVSVVSGPLKGTSVFVAKSETDSGDQVFTIQREDPLSQIHVCAMPRSSLLGYGCSVKDSGRARACTTCEETR